MENKLESVDQKSSLFSKDESKLNRVLGELFTLAVLKMSLAKNIKLAEGTLGAWEECMIEDIKKGVMDFEDFLAATSKVIRESLYNRIDYADIYKEATALCSSRRSKVHYVPAGTGVPMPEEIREAMRNVVAKMEVANVE